MKEINALHAQIDSIIADVVTEQERFGTDLINPVWVANAVDKRIDPDKLTPLLKGYASMMHLRELTRKYLARRHEPVKPDGEYQTEETPDFFADELQPYYPVERETDDGTKQKMYAKLETMNAEEMEICAAKMRGAGESLLRHADALDAYRISRFTDDQSA